jgi:hypothetical protein
MNSLSDSSASASAVSHFLSVHAVTLPNFRYADTVQRFSLRPVSEDSIQAAVSIIRRTYVDDKYGRSGFHLLFHFFLLAVLFTYCQEQANFPTLDRLHVANALHLPLAKCHGRARGQRTSFWL